MRLPTLLCLVPLAASAEGFQRLQPQSATATSFLKSNWNKYEENYHPNYALDDDPKTAWVEGADGDGVNESIRIPVSALKSARAVKLIFFNGYQKSAGLLAANAAPKDLTVTVLGPTGKESAKKKISLEKKLGPQTIELPLTEGIADVVLTIDSVTTGTKYKDTCLSDVQIFVDSDVPYVKAVEDGKKKALSKWRALRLAQAKYFAKLPPEYPYAAPTFDGEDEDKLLSPQWKGAKVVDGSEEGVPNPSFVSLEQMIAKNKTGLPKEDAALIAELVKLKAGLPKDTKFYTVSTKTKEKLPDGVPLPEVLAPLIHLGDATLFEAQNLGDKKPVAKGDGESTFGYGEVLSNVALLEGTPTDPKKVYLVWRQITTERTTSEETHLMLAVLQDGKLSALVTRAEQKDDYSGRTDVSVMRPTWNAEKKISGFDTKTLRETSSEQGPDIVNDGVRLLTSKSVAVPNS